MGATTWGVGAIRADPTEKRGAGRRGWTLETTVQDGDVHVFTGRVLGVAEWVGGASAADGVALLDVVSSMDGDAPGGSAWVIVHVQARFDRRQVEDQFNRWYSETHVPELCANEGFTRNWRLRSQHREAARLSYWSIYEVRELDDWWRAIERRVEAGKRPFDGLWSDQIETYGSTIHRVTSRW